MHELDETEAKVERSRADTNGAEATDPLAALRQRHRYLTERTSEVFAIPGYQEKLGMRLRALSRDELKEISTETVENRRAGREDWDLVDNTDTLLRACEAIMWRDDPEGAWRGLHEYPSAGTDREIRFDERLADVLGIADEIERGENAEAESRQVLWAAFTDTWRVSLSHDDYMAWRTFADEDGAEDVKAELRDEVEQEAEPGEAHGAT